MSVAVTPITARAAQQLTCGHVVDTGERLYDLALASQSVSLCAGCVDQIGRDVSAFEQQRLHMGVCPRPGDPDWVWPDPIDAAAR